MPLNKLRQLKNGGIAETRSYRFYGLGKNDLGGHRLFGHIRFDLNVATILRMICQNNSNPWKRRQGWWGLHRIVRGKGYDK